MHFCFISACMDGSYYLTLNKAVKVNLCYGGMSTAAYCSLPISAINFFACSPKCNFCYWNQNQFIYSVCNLPCFMLKCYCYLYTFLNVRIYLQPWYTHLLNLSFTLAAARIYYFQMYRDLHPTLWPTKVYEILGRENFFYYFDLGLWAYCLSHLTYCRAMDEIHSHSLDQITRLDILYFLTCSQSESHPVSTSLYAVYFSNWFGTTGRVSG